jgi:tight adherence protein B
VIALVVLLLAGAAALQRARRTTASSAARGRLAVDAVIVVDTAAPTWLDSALTAAAVPVPAATVRGAWAIGGTAAVVAAIAAGGAPLAALVSLAVLGVPPVALRLCRGRRDRVVESSMPLALDSMARSLRSGGSLRQAIEEASNDVPGPLGEDLDRVAAELRDGVSLGDALARWSGERPLAGVRLATAALALGAETGGASAQAIDGVAATLRTNVAIAGEVRALSSQARMSALVIALAPIAFMLMAASSDGRTATFLLRTPIGLACLCAGLGLDLVGGLWMRKITAIVV